jgi:hypothetical protein
MTVSYLNMHGIPPTDPGEPTGDAVECPARGLHGEAGQRAALHVRAVEGTAAPVLRLRCRAAPRNSYVFPISFQ